jgi:hypothetical protein
MKGRVKCRQRKEEVKRFRGKKRAQEKDAQIKVAR